MLHIVHIRRDIANLEMNVNLHSALWEPHRSSQSEGCIHCIITQNVQRGSGKRVAVEEVLIPVNLIAIDSEVAVRE